MVTLLLKITADIIFFYLISDVPKYLIHVWWTQTPVSDSILFPHQVDSNPVICLLF